MGKVVVVLAWARAVDRVAADTLAVRGARVLLNTLNSFAPDEASLHEPVSAAENKVWVISANKVDYLVNEGPREMVSKALNTPVETLLGAGESMESALKRADAAMYQAKQAGRNRVMIAPLPAANATTA